MADQQELTQLGMVAVIGARIRQMTGMRFHPSQDEAVRIYRDFLESERITFGNRHYAWDVTAAITLADEDMSHWEARHG